MPLDASPATARFHWDGTVVSITIFTLTVVVGTLVWTLSMTGSFGAVLSGAIGIGCIVPCFAFVPIRLHLDDKGLHLKKAIGSTDIPLHAVRSVESIAPSVLDGSIRTFGSGGFLGYLGHFKNKRLGHYIMYATELRHLLKVETDRKVYVFSCRAAERFEKQFERYAAARRTA